jgi:hypothetical protein
MHIVSEYDWQHYTVTMCSLLTICNMAQIGMEQSMGNESDVCMYVCMYVF